MAERIEIPARKGRAVRLPGGGTIFVINTHGTQVLDGGAVDDLPPVSKPGDYVMFRAEMDTVMVFSACPQDTVPVNGADCRPLETHFTII